MEASPNVWGIILFLRVNVLWGVVLLCFQNFFLAAVRVHVKC